MLHSKIYTNLSRKLNSSSEISFNFQREDHKIEILNQDQLMELAEGIAKRQTFNYGKGNSKIFARFKTNQNTIQEIYNFFRELSANGQALPAGADWLLDNYFLIRRQLKEARELMPKGFYRKLPKLTSEAWNGFPRIYELAVEFISHTDSRFDVPTLSSFLNSYQSIADLQIAELWAFPVILRLALVENLRRCVENLLKTQFLADSALKLVDSILDHKASGTEALTNLINLVGQQTNLVNNSSTHLLRELRSRSQQTVLAQQWIEEKLREQGRDPAEVERLEQFYQAANQITLGNTVTSIRLVSVTDWQSWFGDVSVVHKLLMKEPDRIYLISDFETQNLCRNEIEYLANKSGLSERAVIERTIAYFTSNLKQQEPNVPLLEYLLSGKRWKLRLELAPQLKPLAKAYNLADQQRCNLYLGTISLISILITYLCLYNIWENVSVLSLVLIIPSLLLLSSEFSIQLLNWVILFFKKPHQLAKLRVDIPINIENKTIVVVNTIIKTADQLKAAVDALEVKYLANPDNNLSFAVLADLAEADTEFLKNDEELFNLAAAHSAELNRRYNAGTPKFFVLFRKRQFSNTEDKFLGWERKRGKLAEFNHLLAGSEKTSFVIPSEYLSALRGYRYVITLDADTQLPQLSARKLVACIAHPLNRAVIDPKTNLVVKGYAVLQPLMINSITSSNLSQFARLLTSEAGLDPYTKLVSELYQDLFHEGSYIGKGIYDIAAFDAVLQDRVPEESLLSHDLFEGNLARAALASDIILIDDVPSNVNTEFRRRHRWTRGDWQLLPWLFPQVPSIHGKIKSYLPKLAWWKIFDNLRRSLLPVAALCLYITGALLEDSKFLYFTFSTLICWFAISVLNLLLRSRISSLFFVHLNKWLKDFGKSLVNWTLAFCFLPTQAYSNLDAIFRTIYRVYVSRKKLLEWVTAESAEKIYSNNLVAYLKLFYPNLAFALISSCLIYTFSNAAIFQILPIFWLFAPIIAWQTSTHRDELEYKWNQHSKEYLRRLAFDTWKYFDTHLNAENNFLIPDNLQIVPNLRLAPRTSSTNIGFSLFAVISAYDLGFISLPAAIKKLGKILESVNRLEKFSGHLLNWYDTRNMRPLMPRYISFVDSGNFFAYVLCVQQFLAEALKAKLFKAEQTVNCEDLNDLLAWITNNQSALEKTDIFNDNSTTIELNSLTCEKLDSLLSQASSISEISEDFSNQVRTAKETLGLFASKVSELDAICKSLINGVDFAVLYDHGRRLFTTGYNLESGNLDPSYYDLLASEARVGSLLAIALRQVEPQHWFELGRGLVATPGGRALMSWSGTMFEYLMPNIVTKEYEGTLITRSNKAAARTQVWYGRQQGVPWGISESAHAGVDFESTYQYRAFGVPLLGLKRGLEDELVVSPYSCALALAYTGEQALNNLERLEALGARGEYGFFEAVDYTRERLSREEKYHVVKTYFAHHQGMVLASINNLLNNNCFQQRFHSAPIIKASELLLQERFPDALLQQPADRESVHHQSEVSDDQPASRFKVIKSAHTQVPYTHVISNGNYSVMLDNSGSGKSWYRQETLVNNWLEDPIQDNRGQFVYIKDLDSGAIWTSTYLPSRKEPDDYEMICSPDKVEFKRRDEDMLIHTEITVSPEHNLEVRRLKISNLGNRTRRLQISSFAEVAMASERAFSAHPAFSRMFIESEYLDDLEALVFRRRPRSHKESELLMFHQICLPLCWDKTYYDSDRRTFLGRCSSFSSPEGLKDAHLNNSDGAILDPCMSLQTVIEVNPGAPVIINFITGMADNKDEVKAMLKFYHEPRNIDRAFDLSWSQANVEMRHEKFSLRQSQRYQRLANALFFRDPDLSAESEQLNANRLAQQNLWRLGISGDRPIVLLQITDRKQAELVKELLFGHEYLRRRGVIFELLILNECPGDYLRSSQELLQELVAGTPSGALFEKPGGVYLRNSQQISAQEKILLQSYARVILHGSKGTIKDQISEDARYYHPVTLRRNLLSFLSSEKTHRHQYQPKYSATGIKSGYGVFSDSGKEYELIVGNGQYPLLPYSNVISNQQFGIMVTETGGGYTWSQNSRENRISPWSNDPILDYVHETIFIRDQETGKYWSTTPQPAPAANQYLVSHGFGYTNFTGGQDSLEHSLKLSVDEKDPVKYLDLEIKNLGGSSRKLELFYYVDLVLGVNRQQSYRFVHTAINVDHAMLTAQNFNNAEFSGRLAFAACSEKMHAFTTDRNEFIGRNRNLCYPAFLDSALTTPLTGLIASSKALTLSGKTGADVDPVFVIQVDLEIHAGESKQLRFILGETDNSTEAIHLVKAHSALDNKIAHNWDELLNKIQIKTPEASFDLMVNGWLLYQTLSCRIMGRSAFYQSGGAIGYRDQLQDVLSLLYLKPELVRKQIVLHASRQFPEGDVQHWWHPPSGRGTRTRITDDRLWLPYAVCRYIEVTGDYSVLDEQVAYLNGAKLEEHQVDQYFTPNVSDQIGTVLEHCIKAIEISLARGQHGIPLMGGGDWNDGMDEVGIKGQGESVFLGWFLVLVLDNFANLPQAAEHKARYQRTAIAIKQAINDNAWDGAWYMRAFFDNGTPMGSKNNQECQIDSLAQSWSVLANTEHDERIRTGMQSAYDRLVDKEHRIIKLLDPAFDTSDPSPGYIQGYLPGIRENGAQYTHAASWLILAFAKLNEPDKAFELFQLINPLAIGMDKKSAARYQAEPYVLAGDVYSNSQHPGRAGWSWYTGSAGWMYRIAVEEILGIKVYPNGIKLEPRVPTSWDTFSASINIHNQEYKLEYSRNASGFEIICNNQKLTDNFISF